MPNELNKLTYQRRQDYPVVSLESDSFQGPGTKSSDDGEDGEKRKDSAQSKCCQVNLTHSSKSPRARLSQKGTV